MSDTLALLALMKKDEGLTEEQVNQVIDNKNLQPKLTAGENINISADNVISATDTGLTQEQVNTLIDSKNLQPKLTAGENITIQNNVISATDTGLTQEQVNTLIDSKNLQPKLTAGTNITIQDNVISSTDTGLNETEVNTLIDNKNLQPKLTAGDNITISADNVISATASGGGYQPTIIPAETVTYNSSDAQNDSYWKYYWVDDSAIRDIYINRLNKPSELTVHIKYTDGAVSYDKTSVLENLNSSDGIFDSNTFSVFPSVGRIAITNDGYGVAIYCYDDVTVEFIEFLIPEVEVYLNKLPTGAIDFDNNAFINNTGKLSLVNNTSLIHMNSYGIENTCFSFGTNNNFNNNSEDCVVIGHSNNANNGSNSSLAAGYMSTLNNGQGMISLGYNNQTSSNASAALGGYQNIAAADSASVTGNRNRANGKYQFVCGKCNDYEAVGENKYAFMIGNGESESARSNALTVDWAGNLVCNNIPAAPTADGNYVLKCSIVSGVPTYSWVAEQ